MAPTVDNLINELVQFEVTIKKMNDEHEEHMKSIMQQMFAKFFAAFPQVKTIHWNQYIPYFNDGDECTFTMDDIQFNAAEYTGDRYDDEEGGFDEGNSFTAGRTNYDNLDRDVFAACTAATSVLESLSDTLQTVFGDHVSVFVTAKEAAVEEYEHD